MLIAQAADAVTQILPSTDWMSVLLKNYGPQALPLVGILLFYKLIFQPMIEMVRTDSKANALVADTNKETAQLLIGVVAELRAAVRELKQCKVGE